MITIKIMVGSSIDGIEKPLVESLIGRTRNTYDSCGGTEPRRSEEGGTS